MNMLAKGGQSLYQGHQIMGQMNMNRKLSLSQFFMDSTSKNKKAHHISYRPSIFGGRRKSGYDSNETGQLYGQNNAFTSNGINLVLQFEQQLLQLKQRKHNEGYDQDSKIAAVQNGG